LVLGSGLAAKPPGGAPPPRSSGKSANSRERDTLAQPRTHDASPPPSAVGTTQTSMEDMMAAQRALAEMSLQGQLMASEMSMNNQSVGALSSMAVQTVTDQAKAGKEAVRALGEAFQKAN
jgi:hypothetical protein